MKALIIYISLMLFFYQYYICSALLIGYLPAPNYPDPKLLSFEPLYDIAYIAFCISTLFAVAMIFILIAMMGVGISNYSTKNKVCYILIVAIHSLIIILDPLNVVQWFFD